jgi:Collagen triple helix repeat (20 copies)
MITLNSITQSILAHCDSTVTDQPVWQASWGDHIPGTSFSEGNDIGVLADTTNVIIVGSPATGTRRNIKTISFYNADSIDQQITVYLQDTNLVNPLTLFSKNIVPGENLIIDDEIYPQINVQGVTGFQGQTGVFAGVTGLVGTTGIQGITGIYGTTGVQGPTGVQGITGIYGTTGVQGPTGVQGITGIYGTTGVQGITGIQGITGVYGLTGIQGNTGFQGQTGVFAGVTGLVGGTGVQGVTGIYGLTGAYGVTGLQSVTGSLNFSVSAPIGAVQTGIMGTAVLTGNTAFNTWTLLTDVTSSINVDVQKSTYSGWPNTSSMHGSTGIYLTAATKNTGSTSYWLGITGITGDNILVKLTSSDASATKVILSLAYTHY